MLNVHYTMPASGFRQRLSSEPARTAAARSLRALFWIGALSVAIQAHALSITAPTSATIIPAGDDYATQILGNAWDMNDNADVDVQESLPYVTGMTFGSGGFSGTTSANGAGLYPLYMGYADSINIHLNRGADYPIDTTHYRYVTIKWQVDTGSQALTLFYLHDPDSYGTGTFGQSHYYYPPAANQWFIQTIDLANNAASYGPDYWNTFPQYTGLRVDPANGFPVGFTLAWIRLTAPATSAQMIAVQWTDSGYSGTYNIAAIDASGTRYTLGIGVSGPSYNADFSFLEPGAYTLTVVRSDNSASATSATFHINVPSQISITAPSAAGDLTQDFASTILGNPWGPFTDASFASISNFTSHSYPGGNFYGRPATSDPGWIFNLNGHPYDAGKYRSLCIAMEVYGSRSFGGGSVARFFWGNSTNQLTTSMLLPLDDNAKDTLVGHYCIADVAAYPPDSAATIYGPWSGIQNVFRIDPDEFTPPNGCNTPDTCHDVQLNSVTLSPFALANPGYTFQWTLTDADNPTGDTVDVYLDPDKIPLNGNEVHMGQITMTGSNGQFTWAGSCANDLTYGPWNVLMVASDGINPVSQYSGGPLLIGRYDGIFRNGFEAISSPCP